MRLLALALPVILICGCTAGALQVSSTSLSDEATYLWLASVHSEAKTQFAVSDEKITLAVRLAPNLVGMYQWFRVEWIAPHGAVYLSGPARTRWGSHQELITEMPIRGEAPSWLPGNWKVRLYHDERLLLERAFEITGTQLEITESRIKGLRAGCPPLPSPPGDCIDMLPEEGGFFEPNALTAPARVASETVTQPLSTAMPPTAPEFLDAVPRGRPAQAPEE